MARTTFFDSVYTKANVQNNRYVWGSKPNKLVVKSISYLPGQKLLDIGVGEGKDAMYLAKQGFSVLGIECSKIGIQRLKHNLKESDVHVQVKYGFIEDFVYTAKFDGIYAINALQFVERTCLEQVIENMKSNTNNDGINVVQVATVNDPRYKVQTDRYFFKIGELKKYYKDWDIMHYKEFFTKWEKHSKDDTLHRHAVAEIIARKK